MIAFLEDERDVDIYLYLREKVNWKKIDRAQAQRALDNSLKVLTAYNEDGEPIGMGRIVGDGAVISYIQDLVVIPEAQGQRIGSALLEKLIGYVDSITVEGSEMMLCLMCAKGRENFYQHHKFIARPTDSLGPGMIQYISKK